MSFFDNATEMSQSDARASVAPLLLQGEMVKAGFALIRDRLVFTNCRIIFVDIQGMTGKKKSYKSVPYGSVNSFAVETAGSFDLDAELKIWVRGHAQPIEQDLHRQIDTSKVSRLLARHVLPEMRPTQETTVSSGDGQGEVSEDAWRCRCGEVNEDSEGNYCVACGRSREAII